MELRYLEIFCKVVECGSFSKAAEALYLTQPTVSIHIKTLEDELSARLLDRLGRRVVPTSAGEILYGYAKNIVKFKDEAQLALDQFSGKIRGNLIVGASTIPGEYIMPLCLSSFKSLYPEVYPMLKIGDTRNIYNLVLQGEADIGVVGAHIKDRNIIVKRFIEDKLILVAPYDFKKSGVTKKELSGIPLLQREIGSGSRAALDESLKNSGINIEALNVSGEMGSTQALIQAVRSGMGLSFISMIAVKEAIGQGLIKEVKVSGLTIKRHFYIITHRMRFNSPICKTFIEFLTKEDEPLKA